MTERKSMHALKRDGVKTHCVSQPVQGFYEMRTRDGTWQPVKIWFGPSIDPSTGEECDRSPHWQALVAGREADALAIWPSVCVREITREQYVNGLMGERAAEPKINLRDMAPIFPPRRTS